MGLFDFFKSKKKETLIHEPHESKSSFKANANTAQELRNCTDNDYPSEENIDEFPQYDKEVIENIIAQTKSPAQARSALKSLQARALAISPPDPVRVQDIVLNQSQEETLGKEVIILIITSQDGSIDINKLLSTLCLMHKNRYRFTSNTEVYFHHFTFKTWLPKELAGHFVASQTDVFGMIFGDGQSHFSEKQWKDFKDNISFDCWVTDKDSKLLTAYVTK